MLSAWRWRRRSIITLEDAVFRSRRLCQKCGEKFLQQRGRKRGEMGKLPDLTQQPVQHVDATPNEGYPLRILRAYRQHCDCNWAETTDGQEATNPLLVMMNEQNRQRAEILDRAIQLLEAHQGRRRRKR